jgi:biotin carboxyl carrier protein
MPAPIRYHAKLKGTKAHEPVELQPLGPGRYRVTWKGRSYDVDALALEHGAASLIVDGESFGAEFEPGKDELAVLVRGQVTKLDVATERQLRMRAASAAFSVEGKQLITAPMPGKVVKLLAKVGDEVQAGQGLVVVEAMKMENELKAPRAGKVTEIHVQEGQAVENNAKLVAVE